MKTNQAAVLLTLFLYACTAIDPSAAADQQTLAESGKTAYKIVIPENADVSDKAVAADFADILRKITGAAFAIVTDDSEPGEYEIVVGADNARLAELGLDDMARDFGEGEYEIRTVGKKLVIAGAPIRGTINGMYGFLQDHLGCRWFTPGCMKMPRQTKLTLGEIQDRQKPDFIWRTQNPQMHWDGAWTARNRLNECKTFGGTVSTNMLMSDDRVKTIGNYASGHAMSYIPKSLFETHPEYYSMTGGKRTCPDNPNQRNYCMSNDGLARYMADVLKKKLRGSENERRFVGLGHPDNGNFCQCDVCKASYDVRGISGTYMVFDNKVTEMVVAQYPKAVVTTLAYGISYPPPKDGMTMHPNLRVVWCPISSCYAHGFGECDANLDRHILEDLAQWQATSSRLTIWHYTYQSDELMPMPRMRAHAQNLRAYAKMNVQGVFGQDTPDSSRRTHEAFDGDKLMPAYGDVKYGYFTVPFGLLHLRGYLFSRLLWDVDFDWEKGVRDFCETYYGPAADEMARFVLLVESIDSYEKTMGATYKSYSGVHMDIGIAPKLKATVIDDMNALFEKALPKVGPDKTYLRRVELARASVDLAILCFAAADSPLRQPAFDCFFALTEELGLKRIKRTIVSFDSKTLAEFKALMLEPDKLVIPGEEPVGLNLLANSSFELAIMGTTGVPDSWQGDGSYLPENYTVDPAGIAIDTTRAYSGKACVKLTKKPAKNSIVSLRQRFDVKPGISYRAKVRYQADVTTGGAHIIFTAFNKEGKWLRHQSGARGIKQTGDQWRELAVDTKSEDDTAQLMIEFLFYNDQADGVAWIDDFECAVIEKASK